MVEVKGHTGTVTLDGSFLTISRKGGLGRLSVGKGEKRIPLASIVAVQWKPAGAVVNGYIEFTIGGGNEGRSRFGKATSDAAHNENAVVFTKKQMADFQTLRVQLEQAIAGRHDLSQQRPSQKPSVPDQIAQLAALRDQGILSVAEFDAKKSELLDRM